MDLETTTLDMSATSDVVMIAWMEETFGLVALIVNIVSIITFILSAYGLFLINKKLGEKHAWLSFVPLLQIYNYLTASKKTFVPYILLPFIAIIIGTLIAVFTFGISMILAYLYAFIMAIILLHSISKRCGRGWWTTVGFIFIPFIMMPVVWMKLNKTLKSTIKETVEL